MTKFYKFILNKIEYFKNKILAWQSLFILKIIISFPYERTTVSTMVGISYMPI